MWLDHEIATNTCMAIVLNFSLWPVIAMYSCLLQHIPLCNVNERLWFTTMVQGMNCTIYHTEILFVEFNMCQKNHSNAWQDTVSRIKIGKLIVWQLVCWSRQLYNITFKTISVWLVCYFHMRYKTQKYHIYYPFLNIASHLNVIKQIPVRELTILVILLVGSNTGYWATISCQRHYQ